MRVSDELFLRRVGAPDGFVLPHRLTDRPPGAPLLVAFSGGADSRLLLHLCVRYAGVYGGRVFAAHLNHGIRGEEADRDEAFCRSVADGYGVPLFTERADVPALARERGQSLETAAREARYAFLASVVGRLSEDSPEGPPLLLTAHNADDQLETILLRLLRGTGTRGLSGIPPVRPFAGTLLIRPLLGCTKADVLSACEALGLSYIHDSTNDADDCTRNRLRHAVIPLMEEIAGGGVPQRAAVRMADAVREDDAYLSGEADAAYEAQASPEGLPLTELAPLPPAIRHRVLLNAYRDAVSRSGTAADALPAERTLEAVHLAAIDRLIREGEAHAASPLPFGWRAVVVREEGEKRLAFLPPAGSLPAAPRRLPLAEGDNAWDDRFLIRAEALSAPVAPLTGENVFASVVLPLPDGERPLYARVRGPGDAILCRAMHKRIKKLICDRHYSDADRASLPLVCLSEPDEVLWVPGAAVRDGFPAPAAGRALRISVIRRTADV